jgi:hypothetical protein
MFEEHDRLISYQMLGVFLVCAATGMKGFRTNRIDIGNLRDRIATDILLRPDVAAYEYLATGSFFGKPAPRVRLDEKTLTTQQKAVLPSDFFMDQAALILMSWRNNSPIIPVRR